MLPSRGILKRLDTAFRMGARKILHLPETTSSSFFYCSRRDGGSSLHQMVRLIPNCVIRRNLRLLTSRFVSVRKVADSAGLAEQNQQLIVSFNLPLLPEGATEYDPDIRLIHTHKWATQPVHGVCAAAYRGDAIGNSWISRPGRITEGCYLGLLKMRSNVYPTRETLTRGARGDFTCPRYRLGAETISHVSGVCVALKAPQLARHNKICNLVAKEAVVHGWSVSVEPSYIVGGSRLIPDLVFSCPEKVVVVDVTVQLEQGDALKEAYLEKVRKYRPLVQMLLQEFDWPVEVHGLPISACGAWYRSASQALEALGIRDRPFRRLPSRTAIICTFNMLRD
uniref:Uncharacterized protein n=1 Tax=Octopus bimaculoides TaxID=37653 RepID=A0A0L8FR87_OCTBM